MKLKELSRQPFVVRSLLSDPEFDLKSIHHDSRRADRQTAFYALTGQHQDGHAFLAAAQAAGAPALFVTDPAWFERLAAQSGPGRGGMFLVRPGRGTLAEVASCVFGEPSRQLDLLGVTGTNGKATVTFLAAQMLAAQERACGIIGSLGMHLGSRTFPTDRTTPEAPDIQGFLRHCVGEGVPVAAMEVSSIGLHQERTRGLHFRAAALTNLTQDHLDYHGTMEAYGREKERLFLEYRPPWVVLNLEDALGRALAARLQRDQPAIRVLGYARGGDCALGVEGLVSTPDGFQGRLRYEGQQCPFVFPLLGDFNVSNLLAAVGLLLGCGASLEGIAAAVRACQGAPGRFERIALPKLFTVVVDYAHTPDALDNALRAARRITAGRLGVLFGCGGDRDRSKRPQMGAIAQRLADLTVLTTDNPRGEDPEAILADIEQGMSGSVRHVKIPARGRAIHWLLDQARAGDVLLLAGKGSETYQEIAGRKEPFDDREVVRAWAAAQKR